MPTEEEMLPKDKYTVFDRKVKRYRKGIHSELTFNSGRYLVGKTDFSLQNCQSGREYPSDLTRQVSEDLLGFSWSIGVLMCMIL